MKRNWSYFMGGLCIYLTIAAYGWVLEDIIPVTRTYFVTYQSFQKKADYSIYPQKLPESAQNIRYYFYEGFFADKSGYHVALSCEDYERMKENRLEAYYPYLPDNGYCYDGGAKQYIEQEQLKQQRIDFINRILPEDEAGGEYYFLAYGLYEDTKLYSYHCVLCNDGTCEIVEFMCRCPN